MNCIKTINCTHFTDIVTNRRTLLENKKSIHESGHKISKKKAKNATIYLSTSEMKWTQVYIWHWNQKCFSAIKTIDNISNDIKWNTVSEQNIVYYFFLLVFENEMWCLFDRLAEVMVVVVVDTSILFVPLLLILLLLLWNFFFFSFPLWFPCMYVLIEFRMSSNCEQTQKWIRLTVLCVFGWEKKRKQTHFFSWLNQIHLQMKLHRHQIEFVLCNSCLKYWWYNGSTN